MQCHNLSGLITEKYYEEEEEEEEEEEDHDYNVTEIVESIRAGNSTHLSGRLNNNNNYWKLLFVSISCESVNTCCCYCCSN